MNFSLQVDYAMDISNRSIRIMSYEATPIPIAIGKNHNEEDMGSNAHPLG